MVRLPDVGEGVAEAELVEWHVTVGDAVTPDSVLAEVLTDKATVEISSPVTGVVTFLRRRTGRHARGRHRLRRHRGRRSTARQPAVDAHARIRGAQAAPEPPPTPCQPLTAPPTRRHRRHRATEPAPCRSDRGATAAPAVRAPGPRARDRPAPSPGRDRTGACPRRSRPLLTAATARLRRPRSSDDRPTEHDASGCAGASPND